ncbi:MAG: hypothetical protein LBQ58_02680 [Synergistaceae bacterium]|nr:hypothetical protein [Synergistaceae bacterium]
MKWRVLFLTFCLAVSLATPLFGAEDEEGFLVMAHRGASGYRPEHTLEAYRTAIEMGADYIEPDLVSTKDGVLICRHEMNIEGTTNVEEVFPNSFDLVGSQKRWYAYNFTLAEIKQLRARERLAYRNHEYDGLYEVPTLQEVIDLVREVKETTGRSIGIYPETKSPTTHKNLGLPLEDKLLAVLYDNGYKNDPSEKVFIQSFETDNLKYLATRTKIRLIQLLQGASLESPENLIKIKEYAYGIGPAFGTPITFDSITGERNISSEGSPSDEEESSGESSGSSGGCDTGLMWIATIGFVVAVLLMKIGMRVYRGK